MTGSALSFLVDRAKVIHTAHKTERNQIHRRSFSLSWDLR